MTIKEKRFMKAVELRGEKEAAQALGVSQPTIVHSIKDIEAEHNITLFKPNTRPLELTREGILFYDSLKRIEQIEFRRDENIRKLKDGFITVGITYPASGSIAFKVLDDYLSDYRISKVYFKRFSGFDFTQSILEGDIDIAITPYEVHTEGIELIATVINTEWGLIIPSGMPQAKKKHITGNDLKNMPYIIHSDPYLNRLISNHLKTDLSRTEGVYDTSLELLDFLQNGFGSGFITSNEKEFFELNDMTFLPLYPQLKSTFYVYSREYSSLPYYAQKLYDRINKTTIDYNAPLY